MKELQLMIIQAIIKFIVLINRRKF